MYLIFDTETTGFPKNFEAPHTDLDNWPRLVQIAWQCHDEQGNLVAAQNHIIKPEGFTIPYNAEKVHGISTKIAQEEGKPLKEILEKFALDVAQSEILIGHNIQFDLNVTGAEFLRAKVPTQLWDKKPFDTKSEEAAAFCQLPGGRGGKFKWPTLTELHKKLFGEAFGDAHDAAYDVAATARCFFGLLTQKVVAPLSEFPVEKIKYQAPELDEANFAKRQTGKKGIEIPEQFRGKLDQALPFTHLHTHTQFSILQSTSNIKVLVKQAKEMGMPALALTDHGNMHVAFNAVAEGGYADLKIIMGCELYVAEDRLRLKFTKNEPDRRFTQVLLAKDQAAYHRLSKLCSLGYIEGYYSGFPRVDKELIKEYSEGLIALTGSLSGEVPSLILNRGEAEAEEAFKWWLEVFGEDFYVELQRHGLEEEERVNEVLLRFAAKYGVKPVAAHSSYYLQKADADAHDTLLCVKDGEKKSTPVGRGRGTRFGMPNEEYYFKSPQEMNELFSDIPVALENIQEIVDKCSPLKLKRDILMPNYKIPAEFADQDEYLRYLTYEGAKIKYGEITDEVRERLERELEIIKGMGFPGYFLIVQDFINAAKDMGVFVGPGRGCLTADARVVLADGTSKFINEIQTGDKVITESGTIRSVKQTFKYEIEHETLLNFKTYYGENTGITLTKDHKILSETQEKPKNYFKWAESTRKARKMPEPTGKLTWKPAEAIQSGDWVFVPKPQVKVHDCSNIDLGKYAEEYENIKFDDTNVYHEVHNTLCNTLQRTKTNQRFLELDTEWYQILGIFAGDGWIRKNERPTVSFAFHPSERENISLIKRKCEAMGFEYSEGKLYKGAIQLHINSKPLHLFFKEIFNLYAHTSDSKHVPELVLSAPEECVLAFLKGYLQSDGHEDKHKFRFTTNSRSLADQVRFLCWRVGIPASLGTDERIETREAFLNTKKSYYVTIPKDERIGNTQAQKNYIYRPVEGGIMLKIREISEVNHVNYVYDFEVEEEHNYLTTSFLVHNSAAGSAVAYCIGITNIDPIKYALLFERFLNPERISMPDIDIDFDDEGRQSAINYVVEKYGKNQVAQIITYGTMAAKMSIKDVARVQELPIDQSNQLAKYVPDKPGTKLKDAFADVAELREILNGNSLHSRVLKEAKILEGSVRNTGIHAAGVIIAPDDITQYIPVCTSKDADLLVTQFDGKVVEDAGMLKMDFLGLKTLTILKDALRLIEKNHNVKIDLDNIPLEDEKTFELYQRGDTIGTFQFESEGMQMHLRRLKPTDIEDLIAMNALYRPGPMAFIPLYIDRKHGREIVEYPHPLVETILKNTFGIMVYQEQIMQTAQIIAGYSLGGADLLRRAMGKKDKEKMAKERVKFVQGAKNLHNIDEKKADEIFDIMERFAEYGFNRSHSAAYSVVAYQTAYLKANYPAEYMASVLTHNMSNIDKVTFFIDECQRQGVKVLGPDVNESVASFTVNQQGQIRFGMAAIKGTGDSAITAITEEREKNGKFKDIFDFTRRIDLRTVNKKSFESLAYAGAFDGFGIDRALYFAPSDDNNVFLEKILKYGNVYQKEKENASVSLFGGNTAAEIASPPVPEGPFWSRLDKLNYEKAVVGFYVSGHPLEQYKTAMRTLKICALDSIAQFDRQTVRVAGIVTSKNVRQSKGGSMFSIVVIEDFKSSLEIALFNKKHEEFSNFLEVNQLVLITGKVKQDYRDPEKYGIEIDEVDDLEAMQDKHCQGIELQLDIQRLNAALIQDLEALLQGNNGEQVLKIKLIDYEEQLTADLTSKKFSITLTEQFLQRLDALEMKYEMVY